MNLYLGILLALLCAVGSNLAFFFKHRGARAAYKVDFRHPFRTARSLWASPWFAAGMIVGAGAWGLHVAAISLAPLSIVQAVLAGGVALLAVMADKLFGMKVGPRQWWGLALTATGLILLGVTRPGGQEGSNAAFSTHAMIAFEAGLFAVGALLIMAPRLAGGGKHHAVGLAAASGILFGVCNVAVKALTGIVADHGLPGLLTPLTAVAVAGSVVAFYASAKSLQDGEAVTIIAITGTAANISGIAGGIIVFGDPLPSDTLGVAVQVSAFIMVIVASALMPAPIRAAESRRRVDTPSRALGTDPRRRSSHSQPGSLPRRVPASARWWRSSAPA